MPVLGLESYTRAATGLLLGEDSAAIKEKRAIGIQTLSGTGALRVGAEFLAQILEKRVFYYSDPTWGKLVLFRSCSFICSFFVFISSKF